MEVEPRRAELKPAEASSGRISEAAAAVTASVAGDVARSRPSGLPRHDIPALRGPVSGSLEVCGRPSCCTNQTIAMTPGSYQWVQNDGQRVGEDIRADKEGWSVPMGGRTSLTLDETGQATPRPIP